MLLWFRRAAIATWLTGAWYLVRSNNFVGAFTFGLGGESVNRYQLVIGTGAWLGTVMLFNVWVLSGRIRKKILNSERAVHLTPIPSCNGTAIWLQVDWGDLGREGPCGASAWSDPEGHYPCQSLSITGGDAC